VVSPGNLGHVESCPSRSLLGLPDLKRRGDVNNSNGTPYTLVEPDPMLHGRLDKTRKKGADSKTPDEWLYKDGARFWRVELLERVSARNR